jgi:hypothetical protein
MSDGRLDNEQETELTPQEFRRWAAFCWWTTLALAPLLYWVNGPAVSTDQFVVRAALVVFSAIGAIGLRVFSLLTRSNTK